MTPRRASARQLSVGMVAFALVLLASSCRRTEYAQGDEITFKDVVEVYLKVGSDKIYPLKQDLVDLLAAEAEWFAPPGIDIIEKSMEAKAWLAKAGVT